MKQQISKPTAAIARTLMFNGKILADSGSPTGEYGAGERHRYFDSLDDLRQEMQKIAGANTGIGHGTVFTAGKIHDYDELISAVEEAATNELVLIETTYETIGSIDDYERFCELIKKVPGLVMVGLYSRDNPDAHPILIW